MKTNDNNLRLLHHLLHFLLFLDSSPTLGHVKICVQYIYRFSSVVTPPILFLFLLLLLLLLLCQL
jgi:hypothetical protein